MNTDCLDIDEILLKAPKKKKTKKKKQEVRPLSELVKLSGA
ncbi:MULTISPECIES: hypothetical protein [Enterococcus]|nr:hypothetical protein [Enterococcus faecalis]MCV3125553.1 hypothetical protein [Enterococcus faecalis]MDT2089612.1 hypothetical protein [Enterococcus faecalis]MDT2097856.1 hypothetical protein [Enterococcus faecalis]MDT2215565.1 hypothetical protein [Enterococcus faecalis]MDV7810757.1 hypothetical protein [Enterococcus faecalis]